MADVSRSIDERNHGPYEGTISFPIPTCSAQTHHWNGSRQGKNSVIQHARHQAKGPRTGLSSISRQNISAVQTAWWFDLSKAVMAALNAKPFPLPADSNSPPSIPMEASIFASIRGLAGKHNPNFSAREMMSLTSGDTILMSPSKEIQISALDSNIPLDLPKIIHVMTITRTTRFKRMKDPVYCVKVGQGIVNIGKDGEFSFWKMSAEIRDIEINLAEFGKI